MSTLLTINVTNAQAVSNDFFFFQQPAIYTGGPTVYSNSLYNRTLPQASEGGLITFMANLQFYAAVQEANNAVPAVGKTSGFETASQAIDLAAKGNTPANHDASTMSWDANTQALGLAQPVNDPQAVAGSFRITTAKYSPPSNFNAGSATHVNGGVVLSNFVLAKPQTHIDCEPILKYYVQTGGYQPGTVMDFSQSSVNSALCDFTGGYVRADVTYETDGSWSVNMS